MNKYIAATLSIAVAIGPASALDVDLGGQVGGIGVGVGLGVGSNGASAGAGISVGKVGEANVGASLGPSAAAGDKLGDASGLSAGVGSNGSSNSSAASAAASRGTAGGLAGPGTAGKSGGTTTATVAPTKGVRQSIALPRILWPSRAGSNKSGRDMMGYPLRPLAPFEAIPGTPNAVVSVCRQAIVSAAERFGAVHVRVASAGPLSRERRGDLSAPIQVRIDYDRQGGIEVRQARIRCRLDAAGRVIAVT